jgi:DASH complex subunit ASK1
MSISRVDDIFGDSDEEEEGELGFSPPKTIQFHIPQSKLLQTPGRFLKLPRSWLRANI